MLIYLRSENEKNGIGGFIQLTTIHPDGITTKILRR